MSKKNSFTLRETADSDLEKIFHYSAKNWGEDRAIDILTLPKGRGFLSTAFHARKG